MTPTYAYSTDSVHTAYPSSKRSIRFEIEWEWHAPNGAKTKSNAIAGVYADELHGGNGFIEMINTQNERAVRQGNTGKPPSQI